MKIIELGCGSRKVYADSIGVDLRELPGVDFVEDAVIFLKSLEDDSVDIIHSHHFLEHFDFLETLLRESERVLKRGGRFIAVVPHHSNSLFYSDPTHKVFFGLYTLSYFTIDNPFKRTVPKYNQPLGLVHEKTQLFFKTPRGFILGRVLGVIFTLLFNLHPRLQETYEIYYSKLISCYEIKFTLQKK